jgi:hypothetical protein
LREKARRFGDVWREWQKYEPRVFEDTKITDADIARYSLILMGGPAENRVTAKLAAKLPLKISRSAITVGGHAFTASDAAIHLLYPNPRNAQRYVWVVAANSPSGMFGADVSPYSLPEWDYVVVDGHMPAYQQKATRTQTALASGFFDHDWRYSPALMVEGDASVRAKANHVRPLKAGVTLDAAAQDRYVGRYRLPNDSIVEVSRTGSTLSAGADGQFGEMLPQGDDNFYMPAFNLWLSFKRDATGKLTGFVGAGSDDFEASRIE